MKKQYEELKNKIFKTRELYKELEGIIERIERESLDPGNNSYYQVFYDIEDNSFCIPEFSSGSESIMLLDNLVYLISIDNSYNDHFFAEQRAILEDIGEEDLTDEEIIDLNIDDIVLSAMYEVKDNLNIQIIECD